MAIKLTDLKNQRRTIEITYFEEVGEVTYAPGAITEQMFADVQKAQEGQDENALNNILAKLVTAWDVVDENGVMIPIQNGKGPAVELAVVPSPFKAEVLRQVMADVAPNPQNAGISGAGSQRKGRGAEFGDLLPRRFFDRVLQIGDLFLLDGSGHVIS